VDVNHGSFAVSSHYLGSQGALFVAAHATTEMLNLKMQVASSEKLTMIENYLKVFDKSNYKPIYFQFLIKYI